MNVWERYARIEPLQPPTDLQAGIRAEIGDPAWMLGRQWQMGEHLGEDLSSPALVEVDLSHLPIHDPERPELDPTVVPAEALIESEADAWWTLGRRLRLGQAAAPLLPSLSLNQRSALSFTALAPPYDAFIGALDGLRVFASGHLAGNALWDEVPAPPPDRWQPERLAYAAEFKVGGATLAVTRHGGGDVDWYSVDGDQAPAIASGHPATRQVIASRLQYPGVPNPRWWQIEDADADIGSFVPDRTHVASMLFVDVVAGHGDDWFTFPVPAPTTPEVAGTGVVISVHRARVQDSFDHWWHLAIPPGAGDPVPSAGPPAWSLFRTRGMGRSSLVLWPTATTPLVGEMVDEALLGVDEDANLLWAVELRADGVTLAQDLDTSRALQETTPTGSRHFTYEPSTTLPASWHPYRIETVAGHRRFVQGAVADLDVRPPALRPRPRSALLATIPGKPGHVIDPDAVPNLGMGLERRWVLARDVHGGPVLWLQRRRTPLLAGPVSHLRFDVLAEAPAGTGP
jgi:hypothetical protein